MTSNVFVCVDVSLNGQILNISFYYLTNTTTQILHIWFI